jgi:peptide/nickel transport system substrate-binding protein
MPVPDAAMPGRRQFLTRLASATVAMSTSGGLLAACGGRPVVWPSPVVRPKRGGNLKLGLTGGSSADTLDPHQGVTDLDYARFNSLYQPLVWLDPQAEIEYVLAESITPYQGSLSRWVIRLRSGITFHSGKELTADDVIYTFRRIITNGYGGKSPLAPVDLNSTRALDQQTVLVQMTKPYSSFVEQLAAIFVYLYIVPSGFNPLRPNGTGPFVYESFTPGQRSVFVRNKNYWKTGLPYADTLTILDFPDTVSLADALITGAVQGAGTLDGTQIPQLATRGGIKAVASPGGSIVPFTMRVDRPPFNDVRVRQALRLLVDRPQLIESALDGQGTLASDVFSPFDPDFDSSLRRIQDIDQAKFLLKQAGHENLTITLTTSPVISGTVAMALVLAEQATEAGVTIHVQDVPPGTFFGPDYLSWTFAQDYYPYSPYLAQVAYSMLPVSPFNETHTDNPGYISLYNQANATPSDSALHKEILHEMQEFDFTQGGYIIPAFPDSLDAYSDTISGYSICKQGNPLSNFDFEHFYFK